MTESGLHLHVNRKVRGRRTDRVLQVGVEITLIPEHVRAHRQAPTSDVGRRAGIAVEGAIRRKRDLRGASCRNEAVAVLEQLDVAPRRGGRLVEPLVDPHQVQIAGPPLGQIEVLQQDQRDSDDEVKVVTLRLDEPLEENLRRKVAAVRVTGPRQEQERSGECDRWEVVSKTTHMS